MENNKERKYYDLVISLLKNHKKYAEYEPIIDAIIDDIYEHANVVIESVTNEDVVAAYLTKVVATSMITVPKKMKFNPKTEPEQDLYKALNETDSKAEPLVTKSEPVLQEPNTALVNELPDVAEQINEPEPLNVQAEEPALDMQPADIVDNQGELHESVARSLPENQEIEELTTVTTDSYEESSIVDEVNERTVSVNRDYVDRMINEVSSEQPVVYTDAADISSENLELSSTVSEHQESLIDDNNLDLSNVQEADTIHTLDTAEPDNDDLLDLSSASDTNDDFLNSLALSEENTGITVDNEPASDSEPEHYSDEELLDSIHPVKKQNDDFHTPSYKCFDFNIESENSDINSVVDEIKTYAQKHPELRIPEVFNLKYTQKLKLNVVADKLGMKESQVLETLNEIINLVKD